MIRAAVWYSPGVWSPGGRLGVPCRLVRGSWPFNALWRNTEALDEAGIPYVTAVGAMSVWVDLRAALSEPTFAAERKVWNDLVDEHKVVLTPGALCRSLHQHQRLTCLMTVMIIPSDIALF